jgi:hypothetical protein
MQDGEGKIYRAVFALTAGTVASRISQSNISVSRDPARKAKVLTAPPRPNGGVITSGTPPILVVTRIRGLHQRGHSAALSLRRILRKGPNFGEGINTPAKEERRRSRSREGAPSKSSTGLVLLDASSAKLQRRFVRAHNSNDKTNVTNRPLPTETATSVQCSRRGRREVIAGRLCAQLHASRKSALANGREGKRNLLMLAFGRSGVNGGKGTAFTWNWEQMMLPYEFSRALSALIDSK